MIEILLSGSSGVVGRTIRNACVTRGIRCVPVFRDPSDHSWISDFKKKVDDPFRREAILIHAAIPPQPRNSAIWQAYETETRRLFAEAQLHSVGIVLLSSASVFEEDPTTDYERHKIRMEDVARSFGGAIVRMGLVEDLSKDSAMKRWKTVARILGCRLLSRDSAVYYKTTEADITAWISAFGLGVAPEDGPMRFCASPNPQRLSELLNERQGGKVSGWLGNCLEEIIRSLPKSDFISGASDPFLVLRKGMNLVQ